MSHLRRFASLVIAISAAGLLAATPAFAVGAATGTAAVQCAQTILFDSSGLTIGSEVTCTGTSLKYRIGVECEDELRGSAEYFFGPFVESPHVSRFICPDEGRTQWLAIAAAPEFA